MKKVKLITSLSTLGVIGGSVTFSATSCSKDEEKGTPVSMRINDKA